MPLRPEGVRSDRAEVAVFRSELLRKLACRLGLVENALLFGAVRSRPHIAAAAADHRRGQSGFNGHDRHGDAEDLSCAAVVQRRGEARIDAKARADLLMMGVGAVRAATDDAIDLGDINAGIIDSIFHRLDEKIGRAHAGHLPEPAVTHADDGTLIA